MNEAELIALIEHLCKEQDETEWLEFKENYSESDALGEDLSALANSACRYKKDKAYLVFGIENKTHNVVGTSFNPYRAKGKGNQDLQIWLTSLLQPNMGFQIYTCLYENNSIVLFEINPAVDYPVRFKGVAHIRIGSCTTKLSNHPEIERIIWEGKNKTDWSAEICPGRHSLTWMKRQFEKHDWNLRINSPIRNPRLIHGMMSNSLIKQKSP